MFCSNYFYALFARFGGSSDDLYRIITQLQPRVNTLDNEIFSVNVDS